MTKIETLILILLIIFGLVFIFIQGREINRELEKFRNDDFTTKIEL